MANSSISTRHELITWLQALSADAAAESMRKLSSAQSQSRAALRNADAIVTHIEVNDQHGVGALIRKLFGGRANILSVRSANYHNGEQDFGDLHFCLSHQDTSRDAVFLRALNALGENTVARVLCIPYFPDDVRNALAIKEIFNAPICTFLMDDQNVCADGISDDLMRELLLKSALRLAISPELCFAYELKYGCRMCFMPPLVATQHIQRHIQTPPLEPKGVIVGNIWGQRWLELLRDTVRNSGVSLHWYSNSDFRWLNCSKEDLIKDDIIPHDGPPVPDEELVEILRRAPFVVVPTGTLDSTDDRRFIAQLSLPSRIPYILATSHTPVIVLGDVMTGAARFVDQFRIGAVAPYEREAFRDAVDRILQPDVNLAMRTNALVVAGRFADIGAAEWIWQSLARREPLDQRYEDMMPKERPDIAYLLTDDNLGITGRRGHGFAAS